MARILLAEDEQQIGDMVTFKLTNSGHRVVRVGDGEAALAAAERDRPDVIILDVMMPQMDGFEVLRRLRQDERTSRVPVVVLTAKTSQVDRDRCRELGADGFVTKPFHPDELTDQLDSLIAT